MTIPALPHKRFYLPSLQPFQTNLFLKYQRYLHETILTPPNWQPLVLQRLPHNTSKHCPYHSLAEFPLSTTAPFISSTGVKEYRSRDFIVPHWLWSCGCSVTQAVWGLAGAQEYYWDIGTHNVKGNRCHCQARWDEARTRVGRGAGAKNQSVTALCGLCSENWVV